MSKPDYHFVINLIKVNYDLLRSLDMICSDHGVKNKWRCLYYKGKKMCEIVMLMYHYNNRNNM